MARPERAFEPDYREVLEYVKIEYGMVLLLDAAHSDYTPTAERTLVQTDGRAAGCASGQRDGVVTVEVQGWSEPAPPWSGEQAPELETAGPFPLQLGSDVIWISRFIDYGGRDLRPVPGVKELLFDVAVSGRALARQAYDDFDWAADSVAQEPTGGPIGVERWTLRFWAKPGSTVLLVISDGVPDMQMPFYLRR